MMAKGKLAVLVGILVFQLVVSQSAAFAASCLSAADTPGCQYGLPAEQYQALVPIMAANPAPGVHPLAVDAETVAKYSSPAQKASSFTGVLINGPLPLTMAWVITANRPSAIPGQTPDPNTAVMPRYTRVYIYATLKVNGWKWYLIGPGQWMLQTNLALLNLPHRPDGVQGKWVAVDVWQQTLAVYQDDRLVFTTLISSGKPSHATAQGLHHVWIRLITDDMNSSMGEPDHYSLPYVPFVMYFDHSMSLHGAYWHDNFGYAQSHGCVNMSITDAHWLYDWSADTPNMSVYVWSSR